MPKKRCPKSYSGWPLHKARAVHNGNHGPRHPAVHQLHGAASGHPAGLLFVAGLWVASKLIHTASKPWTCETCRHQFS